MSEEAPTASPVDTGPVDVAVGSGKARPISLDGPTSPAGIRTDEAGNIKDAAGNLTGENLFGRGTQTRQDGPEAPVDASGEATVGAEGASPLSEFDHEFLTQNPSTLREIQEATGVTTDEGLAQILSDARGVVAQMTSVETEGLEALQIGNSGVVLAFLSRIHKEAAMDQEELSSLRQEVSELRRRDELSSAIRVDGTGSGTASTVGDLDNAITAAHSDHATAIRDGHAGKQRAAEAKLASLQKQRYS